MRLSYVKFIVVCKMCVVQKETELCKVHSGVQDVCSAE
jgi:hypothetical protein